ncbi:MAG: TatD family hydrolase [Clostridia bacterium]
MKYFETHAHYNEEVFKENQNEIFKKIKEAGVNYIINVGYNKKSSKESIDLASKYENFYAAIGVHPHDVENETAEDIYRLYKSEKTSKIVAIGEIGLDYAFTKDNKEKQAKLFIKQIDIANEFKLPIIVHSREASLDTYQILKNNKPQYGVLLHCFKPSEELVKLVIENGYMVAFGGNITYKRSKSFSKYIKMIPIEQIVIETDSPYLPPIPFRGTINDSSNLPLICKRLAEYKEMDENFISNAIYENAIKFFKIKK